MEKIFNEINGVGKSKYVVNFYDGIKQHEDGSKFFDIRVFSNEKLKLQFTKELESQGYIYKN